jgi:MFS family permease
MIDRPREDEEPGRLGRPFWQLWSASALSNLADGLVKIALPLVAVTLTDSPGLVAGVTLAVTLPWLLFALPVGALADRVDRRIAMVMADVVRAAAMAVLAVPLVLGLESSAAALWVLYAVALLLGTAETVYDTCAQSILPQVVARDRLPRANGRLIAVELTANEFVGPPAGGSAGGGRGRGRLCGPGRAVGGRGRGPAAAAWRLRRSTGGADDPAR